MSEEASHYYPDVIVVRSCKFNNTVGVNLLIPLYISGRKTLAVVDTAAQISMLSNKFWETLNPKKWDSHPLKIRNAQASSYMDCNFVRGVPFIVGGREYKHDWAVGPISDDVILGLDFLLDRNAVINLRLGTIQLDNITVSASFLRGTGGTTRRICHAVAEAAEIIPALSVKLITVGLTNPADSQFMTIPTAHDDILVAACLLDGQNDRHIIEVVNDSTHELHPDKFWPALRRSKPSIAAQYMSVH